MAKPALRRSRTGGSRIARSVLLGALALAAGLYWLAQESEVAAQDISRYALTSLLWVALLIAVAAVCVGLWLVVRRFLGARKRDSKQSR